MLGSSYMMRVGLRMVLIKNLHSIYQIKIYTQLLEQSTISGYIVKVIMVYISQHIMVDGLSESPHGLEVMQIKIYKQDALLNLVMPWKPDI